MSIPWPVIERDLLDALAMGYAAPGEPRQGVVGHRAGRCGSDCAAGLLRTKAMNICLHCDKELTRKNAKYCSSSHGDRHRRSQRDASIIANGGEATDEILKAWCEFRGWCGIARKHKVPVRVAHAIIARSITGVMPTLERPKLQAAESGALL